VYSGDGLKGYGNLIIIKHNEQFLSAYANNRRLFVQEGQAIRQGQKIAEVGRNNDNRLGLHFEIRKDGKSVNPAHYLPKK
ncbi:MAG: peptidoglycan DD-metalloendopeptidase family protein, partial [Methylococcales bacterium]|nr:peptidoglycan DD-metalloendopeptidase family protein [Methylococcales bacterium]